MFVRGGGFIFRQPVVQHTGEMPGQPLRVLIAPAAKSAATLYDDDGKTLGYRQGQFMKREFRQGRRGDEVLVEAAAPEGAYRPAARDLLLELLSDKEPKAVEAAGASGKTSERLAAMKAAELAKSSSGWSFDDGVVTVKTPDYFKATRISIRF